MKIDKSRFTPEERRQYEKLIPKALVPEEEKEEKTDKPLPELQEALKRLERLERIIERSKLAETARKYSMLGEDEDELADTLGKLKKTDAASYDAYISILDRSLELVRKSGLFAEIGKSGRGLPEGSALDKIKSAARELQKLDPKLDSTAATARAWENHPELAEEYDAEYRMK